MCLTALATMASASLALPNSSVGAAAAAHKPAARTIRVRAVTLIFPSFSFRHELLDGQHSRASPSAHRHFEGRAVEQADLHAVPVRALRRGQPGCEEADFLGGERLRAGLAAGAG